MRNLELESLRQFSKDIENINGYDNIARRINLAVDKTSINDSEKEILKLSLNAAMQEAIKAVKNFKPTLEAIISDNVK